MGVAVAKRPSNKARKKTGPRPVYTEMLREVKVRPDQLAAIEEEAARRMVNRSVVIRAALDHYLGTAR